jgi:hypothetical protein
MTKTRYGFAGMASVTWATIARYAVPWVSLAYDTSVLPQDAMAAIRALLEERGDGWRGAAQARSFRMHRHIVWFSSCAMISGEVEAVARGSCLRIRIRPAILPAFVFAMAVASVLVALLGIQAASDRHELLLYSIPLIGVWSLVFIVRFWLEARAAFDAIRLLFPLSDVRPYRGPTHRSGGSRNGA